MADSPCDRLAEHLSAYQKAAAMFSMTLIALEEARPTVALPEYRRLVTYVDQAQTMMNQTREKLEKHTAEHGCFLLVHAAKA
jgi:hypothetical protein